MEDIKTKFGFFLTILQTFKNYKKLGWTNNLARYRALIKHQEKGLLIKQF